MIRSSPKLVPWWLQWVRWVLYFVAHRTTASSVDFSGPSQVRTGPYTIHDAAWYRQTAASRRTVDPRPPGDTTKRMDLMGLQIHHLEVSAKLITRRTGSNWSVMPSAYPWECP